MPFRRVACGVSDKGKLVPVSEVESFIRSQTKKADKDWYVSAYTYPDSIQDYWKANGNSISGYTGEAWSDCLYWDLDYKKDLEVARTETLKLVDFLISKGLQDGLEVYFSGQKGFHVLLKTEEHFQNPVDLARICSGIVKEAGIKVSFDTVVYNITRIFRYPNTVHQETSLLKIPIDYDELQTSADYIRELAEVSRLEGWETEPPIPVKVTGFVEPYLNEEHRTVEATAETELSSIAYLTRDYTRTRRCQEALERGEFGPGERDNAITRMAAYYRGMGFSEEDAYQKISHALELRAQLYPDAADYSDDETSFKVSHVYGPTWKGGMYSCETDEFLANKCSIDGIPCAHDRKMPKIIGKGVVKTGGLLKSYIEYGEDSAAEYPKFGIDTLDNEIRMRPKNFSIVAGASGCVDKDTEFLTTAGWKKISEYSAGDKVCQYWPESDTAEFIDPIEYIKLPCDEFISFKSKYGLDQRLSEEHRVLYYSRKTGKPSVITARELEEIHSKNVTGFTGKIKQSFFITNTPGLNLTDCELRIVVAVIADGHFPSNTNHCVIRLKKERKKERLEKLLQEANVPFTKTICNGKDPGFHRYTFTAPLRDKAFDSKYYLASPEQLQVICDECIHWDGSRGSEVSTNVKETADFLQYAFSATGKKATIQINDRRGEFHGKYLRKSIDYAVVTTDRVFASLSGGEKNPKGVPITRERSEDGFKYCFSVPSKFLVLRRNNKIFVTGNSGKTSLILETIESLNQQKIPHLFFSMDMSDISLFEKLAAKFTNYSSKQIEKAFSKHHRDPVMIEEIAKVLSARLPFTYFDFTSTVTMKHIETTISKLNKDLGSDPVKVVFIDYAGRIVGGGDNAYANASANALMANDVAKNTNTHLMFIAQVSRESGDHTTPLRSSRVAKESGAWEENATFVLTVWRPFGDGIDAIDHYMAIYVAKNRSGSLKEFHFYWEGKTGTIRDMTIEEFNEYVRLCEQHDKGPVPNHPAGHIAQSINKGGSGKANRTSKERVVMKKKDPLEEARENANDTYHPEEELQSPGPVQRRKSSFSARPRY